MSRPENYRNILVVEDEWLIAIDIKMMIEELGHRVIGPARDVASAMTLIGSHQIDAAFLDITLGTEKSYPVANKLDDLGVPFSFVSAYAKNQIPARFHGFDLLPKPLMPHNLTRQLTKMLGKAP